MGIAFGLGVGLQILVVIVLVTGALVGWIAGKLTEGSRVWLLAERLALGGGARMP
jgi:hypothetical protein